ncbi:endonuclease III [Candidatus Parcubacteria bacterium]|nr:endonuclease III [Candidatus Parcubacteria bacterium]
MAKSDLRQESFVKEKTRAGEIIRRLKHAFPKAGIVLRYSNNWELLVAVILSAQCTDKKVNEVTGKLFKKYRTLKDYTRADLLEFARDIKSTGFYRHKTKNILAAAKLIEKKFSGQVPQTMADLLEVPGVARKTANVVLGNAYGVVEGIAVDTHVRRLSQRLGLSRFDDPVKIEQDLMELIPRRDWFKITYLLIEHGRATCQAKKPACFRCVLNEICPSAFSFPGSRGPTKGGG